MKKCFWILAVFILGMAGACLAQSDQPQSLAELAVKKKPAKKAVLRLSDEDLPPPSALPGDDNKSSGASGASSTSDADNQSGKADKTDMQAGKDAGAAKPADQRTNELKQKLASYQKEEDVWKQSAKHYQELIDNEPSDFRRQMYQDSLDNDKRNAALYQQKVEEIQNELAKPQPKADNSTSTDSSSPSGGSQP